ncbi:ABC transporter substrate-binding protein [bacterium]|nr:ABC transporter substrate-binding protein [bacterium]
MMRRLREGLVGVLLLCSVHIVFAQPEALQTALQQLEKEQYEQARGSVSAYLRANPAGRYAAAAELILGRASYGLGDYHDAVERALKVLAGTPGGLMAAQAHYLLASCYQARGDHTMAALELVECLNLEPGERVKTLARKKLEELVQGPVWYYADILLERAVNETARSVLKELGITEKKVPRLGAITRSPEADTVAATPLLNGVRAGVNHFNKEGSVFLKLLERTVPYGSHDAALAAREMIREQGVWGLVLGGREEDMIAAAVEAQAAGVPVVAPGLRYPGLTAIGPGVVQIEADWYREGEIAAIYATDSLHLKTFAVLAPATEMGRQSAGGFTDALARRSGTEVMTLEWYFPEGEVGVNRQFQRIRRLGFRRDFADSLRSEEIPFDSTTFEELWQAHLDSVRRTTEYRIGKIDSNDIAVESIDALFLPIEPSSIELFAPQFAFYNFDAMRIGNSAWYEDPNELYRHREFVEDMVVTSPYYLGAENPQMQDLKAFVAKRTGGTPNIWHVRGFDAAHVLATQIANGHLGPEGVLDGLVHMREIALAAGKQVFAPNQRTALGMWLLTIKDGEVRPENVARRRIILMPEPEPEEVDQPRGRNLLEREMRSGQ